MIDIHGNSVALDDVLEDFEDQGGVDGYWILGDLVALGPDPVGVLTRLAALSGAHFVRGNTDRYVSARDRPPPSRANVEANISFLPRLVEVAETFTWTQAAITATGWMDWLKRLPLEFRTTLPDGTRVLGVHASPGRDDGERVSPVASDEALPHLLAGCDAETIFAGTHTSPCSEP